jgi:hypothetical protein
VRVRAASELLRISSRSVGGHDLTGSCGAPAHLLTYESSLIIDRGHENSERTSAMELRARPAGACAGL